MKKTFTALCLVMSLCRAMSQTYPVDTIYKSGDVGNRINVVILGDGFTKEQLPKFKEEARKFADFFLAYHPYSHYKNYFNFFAIPTASQDSGATNPGTAPDRYPDQPVGTKNTIYGATFGTSIHRLVTVNYAAVFEVLASSFPVYDLCVVLVNSPYYGGSGGSIAVHSLHQQANRIGVHEIGHTFTSLNDEYWAGPAYGWEAPNMSANTDPATITWHNWLNVPGIGIYKHGDTPDAAKWHKPTRNACLMELLDKPFCAVCREATVERILSIVTPIEKSYPDAEGVFALDKQTTFKMDLVTPNPNSLHVEWVLDGKPLAYGVGEVTLSPTDVTGFGTLTANVFDSTSMSRKEQARAARSWKIEWHIESKADPVLGINQGEPGVVRVFPNPTNGVVRIRTALPGLSCISFYNVSGQRIADETFDQDTEIKIQSGSGLYTYRFSNGDKTETGKLVVE
jgi:hypothetical protein